MRSFSASEERNSQRLNDLVRGRSASPEEKVENSAVRAKMYLQESSDVPVHSGGNCFPAPSSRREITPTAARKVAQGVSHKSWEARGVQMLIHRGLSDTAATAGGAHKRRQDSDEDDSLGPAPTPVSTGEKSRVPPQSSREPACISAEEFSGLRITGTGLEALMSRGPWPSRQHLLTPENERKLPPGQMSLSRQPLEANHISNSPWNFRGGSHPFNQFTHPLPPGGSTRSQHPRGDLSLPSFR